MSATITRIGIDTGELIDYSVAWDRQRELHAAVVAGESPGSVLLLEHPPVYTAGRRTEDADRPNDGTPVVDVDRGGSITWHGPGQLVGYPIVRLVNPYDVVGHVRRIEEVLIRTCADLGLATERIAGRSGVWVKGRRGLDGAAVTDVRNLLGATQDRKVAAIGIRVAKGVTMHGFALNCDPDLDWFNRIVACGLHDAGVTSLTSELGRHVTIQEVAPLVERHLHEVLLEASVTA